MKVLLKGCAIFLIGIIPILFVFGYFNYPRYYYSQNEAVIIEVNEYLEILGQRQIDTYMISETYPSNSFAEYQYARENVDNIDDLRNQIEDFGRNEINTYLEKINSYTSIGFEEIRIDLTELGFNELRNYEEIIEKSKADLRETVDGIPNAYYEINEQMILDMSIEEKIGQLFSFALITTSLTDSEISYLSENYIGGVALFGNNITSEEQLINLTSELQFLNNSYPIFISTDQEGGAVKRLSWDPTGSHRDIFELSESEQCNAWEEREEVLIDSGINWNLGLIGDVTDNPSSFIYQRIFTEDFNEAAKSVYIAAECTNNTLQTLKHWPGHGATTVDTHTTIGTLDVISEEVWLETDNLPFQSGIESGVNSIMIGHLIIPWLNESEPASLSSEAIGYLRNNLGYENMIVTDDMMMPVRAGRDYDDSIRKALLAGHDHLFIVTIDQSLMNRALDIARELVFTGEITEEDLNERLFRIFEQKNRLITNMYGGIPSSLIY